MKFILAVSILLSLLAGCQPKNESTKSTENTERNARAFSPSGVYVRQLISEVKQIESGAVIGMREIRDTIFITSFGNEFTINHHRWRLNDYDGNGWVNMAHGEDRPLPPYTASYHKQTKTLIPKSDLVSVRLYFDTATGKLHQNSEIVYARIP